MFTEDSLYKLQCLDRLQISFSSWLVLQSGWAWDYINVCFSWMNAGNSHSYETPHEDDNELHDFIKSCWLNYFPTFIATSHIISLSNLRSFGRKLTDYRSDYVYVFMKLKLMQIMKFTKYIDLVLFLRCIQDNPCQTMFKKFRYNIVNV